MIVVSDTSPLSNLFIIQRLDILQKLYGKVVVPHAVMNELWN
jgi:predicted nucleic acid-binding protein